ncbi:MAG: hypothetical protein LBC95_01340 [Candidatus Nomurabacteria bacterium]|jgi:D-alanyl-D-alanine carboxypeptidase (penicillin-binding protein 5/6)|nr:hypothetical protein [Candidatus Nomurabacteria bacterium]
MNFKRRLSVVQKIAAVVAVLFAIGLLLIFFAATRPLAPTPGTVHPIQNNASRPVDFIWSESGQAAIGTAEHGLKATFGDEAPRPTASLAKVITALVVLDAKPFTGDGPLVTMGQADVDAYWRVLGLNGTNLHVELGEQLTQRQMLDAIMLASANNIADSLAIWAFGSHAEYKNAAEEWLRQHGLTHTTIGADASGYDPGTTSTPSDLFEIGRLALNNPTLAQTMRQSTAVLPIEGEVKNTNRLLTEGQGAIGLKTGNSDQAGSCLLFAFERRVDSQPVTVIGVLLGQEFGTTFDTARALADSAFDGLGTKKMPARSVVGEYVLPWGKAVEIVTASAYETVTWHDEAIQPEIVIRDLEIPVGGQRTVGSITAGGISHDLVVDAIVPTPDLWWRLTHLDMLKWL